MNPIFFSPRRRGLRRSLRGLFRGRFHGRHGRARLGSGRGGSGVRRSLFGRGLRRRGFRRRGSSRGSARLPALCGRGRTRPVDWVGAVRTLPGGRVRCPDCAGIRTVGGHVLSVRRYYAGVDRLGGRRRGRRRRRRQERQRVEPYYPRYGIAEPAEVENVRDANGAEKQRDSPEHYHRELALLRRPHGGPPVIAVPSTRSVREYDRAHSILRKRNKKIGSQIRC